VTRSVGYRLHAQQTQPSQQSENAGTSSGDSAGEWVRNQGLMMALRRSIPVPVVYRRLASGVFPDSGARRSLRLFRRHQRVLVEIAAIAAQRLDFHGFETAVTKQSRQCFAEKNHRCAGGHIHGHH
jgi:hypothetical protein